MGHVRKALVLALLMGCLLCISARAMENTMLKVGIKYGSDAMYSANLQNYDGMGLGYEMGYFDAERAFVSLGATARGSKVTVITDGNSYASGNAYYAGTGSAGQTVGGWHLQLERTFDTYWEAADAASSYPDAFVAYLTGVYAVRAGQYTSQSDAESALSAWGGEAVGVVPPSRTGVVVAVTGTNRVVFYFDCGGLRSLAIRPLSIGGEKPVTWFRGYRYYGSFEYQRVTGGNINVINVVEIEDYVKGCIGWEIGNDKPLEALKAQAVCARTYALTQTRHRWQGFDVCTTTDCQVYQGLATSNELTERAVDETAGVCLYYNGRPVEAFYYSSNGGASEDAKNVWGEEVGYLKGKEDPYESHVAPRISNYNWTATFTKSELTSRLKEWGYNIGTVNGVYVSELTPTGNVYALTFVGSSGTQTVYREACRTLLGLRSLRFAVGGSDGASYYINGSGGSVTGLRGVYTISGDGTVSQYGSGAADAYVITSGGVSPLQKKVSAASPNTFTFTGSGWGHNVGMSQWGAAAMAELGYSYREILEFYYTGVTPRGP